MKKLTYLILALLLLSCSSKGGKEAEEDSVVVEKEVVRDVDTLGINSLVTVNFFHCVDSMQVVLSNPYSDTINLEDKFYICEKGSSRYKLKGKVPNVKINPNSNVSFRISLGLDSLSYTKRRIYNFVFSGKSKDKDIVYLDSTELGNRYKIKIWGKYQYYLEADSLVFGALMIVDSSLLEDKNVPEEETSTTDELEDATPETVIAQEIDSISEN